jgi:hypothetical protein
MPSTALQGVALLLSEPRLPNSHEIRSAQVSEGLELLKTLIDVYFSSFQVIQPMVHVSTWNMAECPTVQLASMACVGAVLSTDSTFSDGASVLSDLCTQMLSWLVSVPLAYFLSVLTDAKGLSDTTQYSEVAYLTSLCLHQIYSLGSGDRSLYQNADRTRGVLIGSLRGLGLLSSRPSLQDQQTSLEPLEPETNDVNLRWRSWINQERQKRLAWASFEYDCSLCTLTSRRGAVDLDELPQSLPCFDALWEAPSAYAWAALRARFPREAFGARLSIVLSGAMCGKTPPEYTSSWGRRLCTQIIGRLLWDLKQLETLSSSSFFGLQSLSTSHQQSKASLLKGLDNLLMTLCHPISASDLVSYKYVTLRPWYPSQLLTCHSISCFLCHYSHLYTADNIMDLVLYIVRSVVSRGSEHDNKVNAARRQLSVAFSNETRRARELAWHAGQILSVANDFIVSAPCEIMRLFMSYIFIIAFIKYYPAHLQPHHPNRIDAVQLDLLDEGPERRSDVLEWIQYGGPARIGIAEDIFSGHASKLIAQDAQKTFQRLISWGLADKFARIIVHYENSDIP